MIMIVKFFNNKGEICEGELIEDPMFLGGYKIVHGDTILALKHVNLVTKIKWGPDINPIHQVMEHHLNQRKKDG